MNLQPEWTKPYIAFRYTTGQWYVPWNNGVNAALHREDVKREFGIVLNILRPNRECNEWQTTT